MRQEVITQFVDVVDVAVVPKHGDLFGEIISGYIVLRCAIMRVLWDGLSKRLETTSADGERKKVQTTHLFSSDAGQSTLLWDSNLLDDGPNSGECSVPLSEGRLHIRDSNFYLMPVYLGHDQLPERPAYSIPIHGLILHHPLRRGQYVRVGVYVKWVRHCANDLGTDSDIDVDGDSNADHNLEVDDDSGSVDDDNNVEGETSQVEDDSETDNSLEQDDELGTDGLLKAGKRQHLGVDDYLEELEDDRYVIEIA